MPRWREKPDYRHLWDVTNAAAFANAMRRPTYGERGEHKVMASLCERLQAMWGDRDEVPRRRGDVPPRGHPPTAGTGRARS